MNIVSFVVELFYIVTEINKNFQHFDDLMGKEDAFLWFYKHFIRIIQEFFVLLGF